MPAHTYTKSIGTAVYLLLWPADGIIRKDDVRRIFDGSIFQVKADEYAKKQSRRSIEQQQKYA